MCNINIMTNKLKDIDLNKVTGGTNNNPDPNRDLNINPNQSDTGTTQDKNSTPGDIKPRQTI